MPVLAKYRPDLLEEAERVGDLIALAVDFATAHHLCKELPTGYDLNSARGKHKFAKEIMGNLRNGS